MSLNTSKISNYIMISSWVCAALMAVAVVLYGVFGSDFAELALHIPALSFPIFVGECLLCFCVLVWVTHLVLRFPVLTRWHWLGIFFFGWILVKSGLGYLDGGAYAFRNAALFYYSFFLVLALHFLKDLRVSTLIKIGCCAGLVGVGCFATVEATSQYNLFMVALFMALGLPRRWLRWGFSSVFAGLLLMHFVKTSSARGCFLGALVGGLFFLWFALQVLKIPAWKQILFVVVMGGLLGGSLWLWGDRNALVSLMSSGQVFERYRDYVKQCDSLRRNYIPPDIKPQLYYPGRGTDDDRDRRRKEALLLENRTPEPDRALGGSVYQDPLAPESLSASAEIYPGAPVKPVAVSVEMLKSDKRGPRNYYISMGNGVFRLLIWRDMLLEYIAAKPLFGFSFAKPQRSMALEVMQMAYGEWSRDGWISPHNVFLHFIYRGGIVGVGLIVFIIYLIARMTRIFLHRRSFRGALLVSALISWLVMAQFGVVLELPYNAIPFWTLFGLSLAYAQRNHNNDRSSKERPCVI